MYQKILLMNGQPDDNHIKKIDGNVFIPFDINNREYQEYLEWVNQGNVPQEAEVI